VITASLYGSGNSFFSASSSPIQFLVQNPKPTPTPNSATGASISPLTITIIATVVVLVAAIVYLLFYRKHRKTTKLKH
jgi:hypothetical protein